MGIDVGVKRDQISNLNYVKTWTNWLKDIWKIFLKKEFCNATEFRRTWGCSRNYGKGPAEAYLKPSQISTMEPLSENRFPECQTLKMCTVIFNKEQATKFMNYKRIIVTKKG